MRAFLAAAVLAAASGGFAGTAEAVPILQLYLEGGTYNSTTESWEFSPPGSSSGAPFRLWAIGNISGPGGKGVIHNVRLAAVYDASVGDIVISLTRSRAGGITVGEFQGFTDPTAPLLPPTLLQGPAGTDGLVPILGDGSELPSHGEYGDGRVWQEFALGHFDAPDSPSGDFIDSFPDPIDDNGTQINVYEVSVTGDFQEHPFTIHFDLYDTVFAGNHARSRFAPFSHDSDADATITPEPGSMLLFGTGLLGLVGGPAVRRRVRRSASDQRKTS